MANISIKLIIGIVVSLIFLGALIFALTSLSKVTTLEAIRELFEKILTK